MAQIDVTELFTDPDFVDQMSVITRSPSVSTLGENFMKEDTVRSVGSIQPISGDTVNKLPEAMRNENLLSFWFKGDIITTAPCKYSSVLVFRNQRFQVRHVFNWSNWGQGWCEGACIAEVPAQ